MAGARSGAVGGRHRATNNVGYTIGQTQAGLTAGTPYDFAGWVNMPATSDAFTFQFDIAWRNASNAIIRTDTVSTFWADQRLGEARQPPGGLIAPANATNAVINMVVTSLNATVYVDDLAFR